MNSSVLKWPDAQLVDQAVRAWAYELGKSHPQILKIGYIGSYARGDWGVGSDVDILILVSHSGQHFEQRTNEWDASTLPVPADILMYTLEEWQHMLAEGRFSQTVAGEAVWIFERTKSEEFDTGVPVRGT